MKTSHNVFIAAIALELASLAPARAQDSPNRTAQSEVSSSEPRDLVRQADAEAGFELAITLDPANTMHQQTADDIADHKPFKH